MTTATIISGPFLQRALKDRGLGDLLKAPDLGPLVRALAWPGHKLVGTYLRDALPYADPQRPLAMDVDRQTEAAERFARFRLAGVKVGLVECVMDSKSNPPKFFQRGNSVGMAVDMMRATMIDYPEADTLTVVTGSGDLAPAIEHLVKSELVQVRVLSAGAETSRRLCEACDTIPMVDALRAAGLV